MSLSAERNEQFSEKEYWEQRYADESEADFDWFKKVCRSSSLPFACLARAEDIALAGARAGARAVH